MSDTFTVKIEGLKELEQKMISLGPEISKKDVARRSCGRCCRNKRRGKEACSYKYR